MMDNKEKTEKKAVKKTKTKLPELEEMLKAGVHFGHRTSKWNAKMEPYIFTSRNNVHVIDLEKTSQKLEETLRFIGTIKKKKQTVLFIGTKVSARDITKELAQKVKMPYVTEKWIGGTLSNFEVISRRLAYFRDLEKKKRQEN